MNEVKDIDINQYDGELDQRNDEAEEEMENNEIMPETNLHTEARS